MYKGFCPSIWIVLETFTNQLLFVCFASRDKTATTQTVSRWVKLAIVQAYKSMGVMLEYKDIQVRSNHSMATSWVKFGGASMIEICRVATWSSHHTFVNYKLELSLVSLNFG